jgi:hypothetical protein
MHQYPGILEFLHTLQADLLRPFLDRQYPATLAVMAADNKLEHGMEQIRLVSILVPSILNPLRTGGARNFRWHPATPAMRARWPERERSSNQPHHSRD